MKRDSARLIIAILAFAAVLWRYVVVTQGWNCHFLRLSLSGYCRELRQTLAIETVIVVLIAGAVWVWTRQMPP